MLAAYVTADMSSDTQLRHDCTMQLNFLCHRRQVPRVKTIKCNASGSRYVTWRLVSRNGKMYINRQRKTVDTLT